MKTVSAIYENGVFRPTGPVDLPERCEVELELRVRNIEGAASEPSSRSIEEEIAEIAAQVPPEAWDALPADLTDQLEHYLYGTPKQ